MSCVVITAGTVIHVPAWGGNQRGLQSLVPAVPPVTQAKKLATRQLAPVWFALNSARLFMVCSRCSQCCPDVDGKLCGQPVIRGVCS
jgi:hypothetical protein